MTARCRAAAVGAVAAFLLLGLVASPVAAGPDDLEVEIDAPAVGADSITVSGSVKPRAEVLNTDVEEITVRLVPLGDGDERRVVACNPCGPPGRFETAVPLPARNGQYRVEVTARGTARRPILGVGLTSVGGSGSRTFGLAAPPRAPQDVKVDVSADRVVTVSWARNAEPDLLHYLVTRKNRDGEVRVDHPATGPRVSSVDTGTTGGGAFTYQVVAVRRGATDGSVVRSTTEKSVAVPAPPPADPTTTAPGAAGGPGAAAAPAAVGGPALVDISSFLAGRSGPSLPTPTRELEVPDGGFSRDLPFGSRPPGEELEEGDAEAEERSLDVGTSTTEFVRRGRPLVPVAGGAVLLLLAMHLRLLNKRVKEAPAAVAGRAASDLPPLDPEGLAGDDADLDHLDLDHLDLDHLDLDDLPEPPPPAPPPPVLFDYEEVAPPPPPSPPPAPADDAVWGEEDWDEAQVQEFVSPAR